MQLLYVANRYERKADLLRWLDGGLILVCDRYTASSIAYGEAQGLDAAWLIDMQKFLPAATLTILLDIAPETAVTRKSVDRDRYERDLAHAGPRPRELSSSGRCGAAGSARRRAVERRDRRRRLQRGSDTTRAAVSARTSRHRPPSAHARTLPASRRSCSHRRRARRCSRPGPRPGVGANAPRTLPWRCAAGRSACAAVARMRRSA